MLWTEKYAPRRFDEIFGQEALRCIGDYASSGNIPNLIFHGPSGAGKRSTALVLASALYGDSWEDNFVYINASDFFEGGKTYLAGEQRFRHILRSYVARQAQKNGRGKLQPPKEVEPRNIKGSVIEIFKHILNHYAALRPTNAPFKIIVIDSSEELRSDAQHALRRIIERYNSTCRFIFSTVQLTKLILPIRSRCFCLYFRSLDDDAVKKIINRIADGEKIRISDGAMDAIICSARGNAGNAINILQASACVSSTVDEDSVSRATDAFHTEQIDRLLEGVSHKKIWECRETLDSLLTERGISGRGVAEMLCDAILSGLEIPENVKASAVLAVGDADFRLLSGLNERVHMEKLLLELMDIF